MIRKLKHILTAFFGFILGIFVLFFSLNYVSLPCSYEIPQTVASSATELSGINVNIVKEKQMSIHFIELGNKYTGDCTLINIGNIEILIDAGSRASSVQYIKQYIDQYIEDGKIEYVIVTHAHQDHYAGFATGINEQSLFDLYEVENIIEFSKTNQKTNSKLYSNYLREKQELSEKMKNKGKALNVVTALDCVNATNSASRVFELGNNSKLEILYQKYYEEEATTENNYSVCFQFVHNNKFYMFTGDLEEDGEKSLIEENKTGKKNENMLHEVEVYKAGHHGSKTSSSEELLSVIKPKNICVCCCAGSSEYTTKSENQFPTQEFINRIAVYTKNVYVTTLCLDYNLNKFQSFNGNIVVFYDNLNNKTNFLFSNNSKCLKDSEWFNQNRVCPAKWN